jgi:hypothetical protein
MPDLGKSKTISPKIRVVGRVVPRLNFRFQAQYGQSGQVEQLAPMPHSRHSVRHRSAFAPTWPDRSGNCCHDHHKRGKHDEVSGDGLDAMIVTGEKSVAKTRANNITRQAGRTCRSSGGKPATGRDGRRWHSLVGSASRRSCSRPPRRRRRGRFPGPAAARAPSSRRISQEIPCRHNLSCFQRTVPRPFPRLRKR